MRIVVVGAGGVGGYFGAKLGRAGQDVTLVARGAHLDAIRKGGLRVRSAVEGEYTAAVTAVEKVAGLPPADAVIGNPPGQCGRLREKVMDDPARLRQSVRKLLDLEFDTLLFGDGTSILHDAKLRLKELVATFPDV
jgi:choline dehydrogenase-like flavoprotein